MKPQPQPFRATSDRSRTLILSVALVLLRLFQQWMPAEDVTSLRVVTFNLHCRNPHYDQILEALKAVDADVLFLQETTVESERFLAGQLNASYPYFYATGHLGRFTEEGLAFASKIPLRDVTFSPPDKGFFGFFSATCRVGETSVKLINVHLTPFVIRHESGIMRVLAEIQRTEDSHAAEIDAVSKKFNVEQPVIVAGDFNSLSTFVAPSTLTKMGLVDSFAATNPYPDAHPTWKGIVDFAVLQLRLDYIFHTHRFQTVKSEVIEHGGSDHFSVVSNLKLLEQGAAANANRRSSTVTNPTPHETGPGR
jgi:endonuclease/exonuclease/phosphatase (EEP) superfamily protein YafD